MADSFNYISFGNWDLVENNAGELGMDRGRMFEYTPSDIEKSLENLNPTAIAFLENLPTFLCTEVRSIQDGGVSMYVKFGWIGNIQAASRVVSGTFDLQIDIGEIEFDSLEVARSIFSADKFQLYRTHWAVRSGDARDVLMRLLDYKPELAPLFVTSLEGANEAVSILPPPRDKKILGTADSVETFLQLLYGSPSRSGTETFFRGHGDAQYELTPTLLRKRVNGDWLYMPDEDRLCKELLIAHYDEFQGDEYCFDRLVRMQHYGLPTRLLDITTNPLIALFFACSGQLEQFSIDGEVIIFQVSSAGVKYYDSDAVSCLSNLSNLSYDQKNEIDLALERNAFNQTPVARNLLHHIKSEKSFFEGRIVPDDLRSIICVKAKRTNMRIKSQSGAFLLFGHEAKLPDGGQDGIEISRITIENKQDMLKQLDRININNTTVYPSIERTADHLRAQYLTPVTVEP